MKSGALSGVICGQNHTHPHKGREAYLHVLGSTLAVLTPIGFVVNKSWKVFIHVNCWQAEASQSSTCAANFFS